MNYAKKEAVMQFKLEGFESPQGFRSVYKAVPFQHYEEVKPFIDFTKYFVMFRGPRIRQSDGSTRKCNAKAFDVYQRDVRDMVERRIEKEAFQRGVQWANNRSN
jgi:hypothetical protein